jgi:hypothetical protein
MRFRHIVVQRESMIMIFTALVVDELAMVFWQAGIAS